VSEEYTLKLKREEALGLIKAIEVSHCQGITCDGCALCDVLHHLYNLTDEMHPAQ
jgi:hypothetical protein